MNVDPEPVGVCVGDGVPIGEGGCVEVREVKGEGEGEDDGGKREGEGEDDGGKREGEGEGEDECVADIVLSPRPVHFSPMITLQSFKTAVSTIVY